MTAAGPSPRASERRPAPVSRAAASSASARSAAPELAPVARRLLEVVADELVLLLALVEPAREPLVQIAPKLLRQRVVGRVADQQMPEAELAVAGRADELLPDERSERLRRFAQGRLVGEPFDRAPAKVLALHRGSLEHLPLLAGKQVEPRREQNLDRRRHRQLAHLSGRRPATFVDPDQVVLEQERDHLLDEERVAACRLLDPDPEIGLDARRFRGGSGRAGRSRRR